MSSLYPDGLINAQWIEKHQRLVPAVYMSFYSLSMDPTTATLEDNKLKADINSIKSVITTAGYKTRLAVIFLQSEGDGSQPMITDRLQERLEAIRKGTGMDPKSMFYVAPQKTPDDLRSVADSILSNLYGIAIEYYRDLGRHARKKRSRGIAPQPTVRPTSGTSQSLSLPDWNFRYDFKTAMLCEFRQEMEPATRSFDQAYEILLGQDVMDTIPSWSPRWNEARLLSDIISIRCLRVHLWLGQPSLAVRRWQAHRDRIGDFVDRRGTGTNNYGWQAWEARWALVMANLIEKVNVPALNASSTTLYLQPEKAMFGERLQPWEMLHHMGYWYRIAARHLGARRTLARMIPEDDRAVPETTSKQSSSQAHMYDNYLCPPPHEEYPLAGQQGTNHSQLIIDCLISARTHFQARKQLRIAAELALECAKEMVSLEMWTEVLAILHPIWADASFRLEGWTNVTEDLSWLLRRAAVAAGRPDLVVAIDWELLDASMYNVISLYFNNVLLIAFVLLEFTRKPHWPYDLSQSLEGLAIESRPSIQLTDETVTTFLSTAFVFRNKESRAGETCKAQLSLVSNAMACSIPITLEKLMVNFQDNLNPIIIEHDGNAQELSTSSNISIVPITLVEESDGSSDSDGPAQLRGSCSLVLKPGQRLVLELIIPLRVAGEVQASSVVFSHKSKAFDIEYTLIFRDTDVPLGWFAAGSSKPYRTRTDSRSLHVQPRPPKLDIKLVKALQQYYANEVIELPIVLQNDEDEAANIKFDVTIFGKDAPGFHVLVGETKHLSSSDAEDESRLTGLPLDSVKSSSSTELVLFIDPAAAPTLHDIQLRATYHLESDTVTPIIQILPIQLNLVSAFEANYDLVPRLHADPWPSLFDYEDLGSNDNLEDANAPASGLAQRWCLMCHYASFAQVDLRVVDTDMQVTSCVGGAKTNVIKVTSVGDNGILMTPKSMHDCQFDLIAQKLTLDDRQPVSVELAFVIRWRRDDGEDDSAINTTTMPVGQYMILGIEPRVLASVLHPQPEMFGSMPLNITIENPSNHLLTFGLTMEPSDEFGFSGAKQTTIHMLPLSRRRVTYRLIPVQRGVYIRPGLVVRDKYFQKILRVIPTEGMKIDKDGLLIWVPGPGGEDAADVESIVHED